MTFDTACTLSRLSSVISSKAEKLLIDILDFLVELIQYKSSNLMDAYRIGDALGKVVLGPADCGPIIQEKAGHFLTRMIIEHAKINQQKLQAKQNKTMRRIDSGISCHSFYREHNPICKSQGTQARAKFYNRAVSKTKRSNSDWIESTVGVQCMFDNDYNLAPEPPAKPWTSIFTASTLLIKRDMNPILFRILMAASKPTAPPVDLASSHVLTANKRLERQIKESFMEFSPQKAMNEDMTHAGEKANPLKKLNHSLSHLKLNIKKYRSRHDLLDESFISQDTEVTVVEDRHEHQPISDYNLKATRTDDHPTNTHSATVNMKKAMRKMIKIGTINYHKEKFNSKIVV